ncbi:hypothetical protein V2J09_020272 [Rumex salicifolius]
MDSDTSAVANLSMLRRRKIIHLVRHAQGIHNLENSANSKTSPELFDAKISPLGRKQSSGKCGFTWIVEQDSTGRRLPSTKGVNTCDKRRNVSEYKTLFPTIDFSLIETEEDTWWTPDVRESDDDVAARGIKFFNWLWNREEEEIAVVTHSAFLFQTLRKFGDGCQESVTSQMRKFFENCELRSMELADGMLLL